MKYAFYITGNSGRLFKFLSKAEDSLINQIGFVISDKEVPNNLQDLLAQKKIQLHYIDYSKMEGSNTKEKNLFLSDTILDLLGLNHKFCGMTDF